MSEIYNLHTLCRCCHKDGIFKNLQLPFVYENSIEVYSTMLRDTFKITISLPPFEASYAICDHCILQLRDATQFKNQVLVNEQKFVEYCKNEQSLSIKEDIEYGGDNQYDGELKDKTHIDKVEPEDTSVSIDFEPKSDNELLVNEKPKNIEAKVKKKSNNKTTRLDPNFEILVKTKNDYNYRCKICGKDYNTLKTLRSHITIKHREEVYKCSTCFAICSNRVKYLAHIKTHSVPPETCHICQKTFPRKRDLTEHMVQHTKAKNYQCDWCQKCFGYKQSLRRHIMWHYGAKNCKYMCDLCGQSFSDVTNMNIHIETVHEKLRPYKCSVCCKAFTRKRHLNGHMSRHTGEWSFNCDECHKGFSCSWKLKQHKLKKHENDTDGTEKEKKRGYNCKICKQILETRGKLLTHTRSHVGVKMKTFKCHICGKVFMYKYTLNRHIDKHNGVQAYECNICNVRFALKYQLTKHMFNIHHPNRLVSSLKEKVKCNICNRHYIDIDKHLESHKKRPFVCEMCKKSYPDKSALNRHIKCVHFKPRPFACDHCNQKYTKLRHLKLHTMEAHKINLKYNKKEDKY